MLRYPLKSHRLTFVKPPYSTELAEFCGIMLGDGGISAYQATVTLGLKEEKEYGHFVMNLIETLFSIRPGMYRRTNSKAFTIYISRIGIVEFLTNTCGLVQGDKMRYQATIPLWILENPEFSTSCIRGLIDTDGSVFTHRYKSKGKEYTYKKMSFTSASPPLLNAVLKLFLQNDFHARIGSRFDVRIDSKKDVSNYFKQFGSHNPKHLKRYQN
jgi:hypothetical protein